MRQLVILSLIAWVCGGASAAFADGRLLVRPSNSDGPVLVQRPVSPQVPIVPQAQIGPQAQVAPQAPIVIQGPRTPQPPVAPPALEPIPAQGYPIPSAPAVFGPVVGPGLVVGGPAPELFPFVSYRRARNMAPCAATMIVSVKDPCACNDACTPARCVNVEICVPQCPCPPKVTTSADGRRTRYDFGKYAVNIVARKGGLIVDYAD